MTLNEIYNKNKTAILERCKPVDLRYIEKGAAVKNNLLMLNLVNELTQYYENNKLTDLISFEINKNQIKAVKINNKQEFETSFFSSDAFSVFIGPFDYQDSYVPDTIYRVLAHSSSSIFFANLYPFSIIENTTHYGIKKAS